MISKELYVDRILSFKGVEVGAALLDRMTDCLLVTTLYKPIKLLSISSRSLDTKHTMLEKQIITSNMRNLPLICREDVTGVGNGNIDFVFSVKCITSEAGILYHIVGQLDESSSYLLFEDYFSQTFSCNREYVMLKIANIDSSISLLY